jgi:hypothetical protein
MPLAFISIDTISIAKYVKKFASVSSLSVEQYRTVQKNNAKVQCASQTRTPVAFLANLRLKRFGTTELCARSPHSKS